MSVGKSGLGFALTQSIAEILAWWCSDLIQYLIVEVLEVPKSSPFSSWPNFKSIADEDLVVW